MFSPDNTTPGQPRPGMRETIAMLAGLMALNAVAIDAMLPALPAIGRDLGVAEENRRQLVVIVYFLGFGAGQLFWGPLADRFGRKPILAVGIAMYVAFAVLCGIAGSFGLLIAGRFAMGVSAAVTRVLVIAMVRDLFEGEAMARVMSLVFMVFMVVPVIAPTIGQGILLVAPWRAVFAVLATYGVVMLVWSWWRLPETLNPQFRRSLHWRDIAGATAIAGSDRLSVGYTLALTAIFGGLTGYIASIQQIVFDTFRAEALIGLVFAAVAAPMALASWTNSQVVERFGLRRVGHIGLVGFVLVSVTHALIAVQFDEPLWLFVMMMAASFICFAFTTSNFGSLAMTNMASVAGTASSLQGVVGTMGGAASGFAIGQAFDGTQQPFVIAMALCGTAALIVVVWTERGRLFGRGEHLPTAPCLPSVDI